jgi:hypothetical protein
MLLEVDVKGSGAATLESFCASKSDNQGRNITRTDLFAFQTNHLNFLKSNTDGG